MPGKALKEQHQWEARSWFKGEPLSDALCVTVRLFYGTKRKADWDNTHKLWQDALSGIMWLDDSQIVEAHVFKGYDKERPRIDIEIIHGEARNILHDTAQIHKCRSGPSVASP